MYNKCREDILNFKQSSFNRVRYTLNNMMACSDVGKVKSTQEDSILIATHPNNDDFKVLAISDGMGGLNNGELASNIVLKQILLWIESLNSSKYYQPDYIYKDLYYVLKEIDELVDRKCHGGGTTLALAIILDKKTILANIGDSRIYLYNNKLNQYGFDHSVAWSYYAWGKIKNKDDLRFHKSNNQIYNALGGKIPFGLNSSLIDNNDYIDLYLFTDGVTDCLSELEINELINQNINNIDEEIVKKAINSISRQDYLDKNQFYNEILGGKDNTSVAVLVKKK